MFGNLWLPHCLFEPWRSLSRLVSKHVSYVVGSLLFSSDHCQQFVTSLCTLAEMLFLPALLPPSHLRRPYVLPNLHSPGPTSAWGDPHLLLRFLLPPPERDFQRCLTRLCGLKTFYFRSILSSEKKNTTCQPGRRQTGLKVLMERKFSMTEVCSWPKERKKAIMVRVNEITAGRSIKQRRRSEEVGA